MYDRGLIYDLFEVLMCMALVEHGFGGGSFRQQQLYVTWRGKKPKSGNSPRRIKYSRKEGNFKHKSVIGACLRMANGITWKV